MRLRSRHTIRTMAALLLGAAVALPCVGAARADGATETLGPNILPNGGFEQGADPGVHLSIAPGSPLLTSWTVVGREAAVYGTYWQAEEGTRSVALANPSTSPTTASGIQQTFATVAGQRYRVIFYQAGNPNDHQPSSLRFQIGGVTRDYTYQEVSTANARKMDWVKRSFVFTATAASTTIGFSALYTPGNDPLGLDNVQVRAIQAAPTAPAPGTGAPGVKPALAFSSATLAVGASEGITVAATPNAPVALVIDAPNGIQTVVPGHADASGHYSCTWIVPSGVHGTVHVLADAAGSIVEGSFTVS